MAQEVTTEGPQTVIKADEVMNNLDDSNRIESDIL